MCHALEVSVSGFYAWQQRPTSPGAQSDHVLRDRIRRTFQEHRGVYGSPRIHAGLAHTGVRCGRKRVAGLMHADGLSARRRPHKPRTTDSLHPHPVAPHLLLRDFQATAPDQKWVADLTAIPTRAG